MKHILLFCTLLLSITSFAQVSGSVEIPGVSIRINGKGEYVCRGKAMLSDRPVLARGSSEREAKALALEECKKQGNAFFCKTDICEKDILNRRVTEVVFEIKREAARVRIGFKGKSKFICSVEAWDVTYTAKAATKVEAMVLASNACADGNKGDAFFCDVKDRNCLELMVSANDEDHQRPKQILIDLFKKKVDSVDCEIFKP